MTWPPASRISSPVINVLDCRPRTTQHVAEVAVDCLERATQVLVSMSIFLIASSSVAAGFVQVRRLRVQKLLCSRAVVLKPGRQFTPSDRISRWIRSIFTCRSATLTPPRLHLIRHGDHVSSRASTSSWLYCSFQPQEA
jgi:hypothetical protein